MKDRFLIVIVAIVLCCMPSLTSGTPGGPDNVSIRNVPYIVVKGDKLKNIAVRFLVPVKTLKKLNRLPSKNFTCYPGMTLLVPVRVRPRGWDPAMEASSDAGMLSQDRLPSVDYEVIGDGFDLDLKDDFIAASEAQDDSVQFIRVGDHIERVDRRINVVCHHMDSLKQAEFGFSHDDDLNSVLGRMRLARDRYYSNGPLGREIDSLHRVKATLNNLRIRLRNRITENEYLRDNVAYAKANYEREEMAKDTHWGDQITYESNYARIKAKHDELLVEDTAARLHTDTAPAAPAQVAQVKKDTLPAPAPVVVHEVPPATEKPAMKVPPVSAPVAETRPAPSPVAKPATAPAAPSVAPAPAATSSVPAAAKGPFGLLQRVDIAPMVIRHAKVDIKGARPVAHRLLPLPAPEEMGTIARTTDVSISAPTGGNATIPATSKASINTVTKTIATAKADSLKHITAVAHTDTIKRNTQVTKADTMHKAVATVPVAKDTSKNSTALSAHVDTAHHTTPVVKADTMHKTVAAAQGVNDTSKHSIVSVAHPDTAHHSTQIAKADTAHKMANATTSVHKDSVQHTSAAQATAAQSKEKPAAATPAPATANNFSLAEDNSFDGNPGNSHSSTSKKQEQPKGDQPDAIRADNDNDAATGGTGRAGRKPKEQNKKDRKGSDAQDQIAVIDSSKILHEQVYVPLVSHGNPEIAVQPGPHFTLDMKYDSTMLYREKKINADPLASYKTDSNFMATDVMLKEIPITEVKNKPKYLIPVDSVSKIKGEFYLIRARQVLERGDFKEGDKYLRKSLELDPNNASTWMLHADLCLTTGAADKALKEYAISSEIDSTNPKVFYNIALLYSKANDNQKAYKYFSRATDVNDKYLLAYMGRATVLMDERDYEGAIQDYDKTLSINRYYSPAYKGRALAKMEAHKFEDAVVDFNQYLEIEDPDGYVLYQRGIAKILSNNLLQGCLDLSSSLELGFKEADRAIKKFCQ
ncbi:MAG: LysM peptidoglycan-binding domain-containing protein [Bacteroidetes bacterium]|nr:LysM peptidoglycan-binding domain-containing protein [Bacteroidota bacterium]